MADTKIHSYSEQLGRIENAVDDIRERAKRIEACLYGNGKPGLTVEIDRLKQTEQRRSTMLRVVLGASITALFGAIWSLVKGVR